MTNGDNTIGGLIASAAERNITSQSELLATLSFALIAGLLAAILQVRISNAGSGEDKITLRCFFMAWCAMGFAAFSILLSYFVSGAIVEMTPQLFVHTFDTQKSFSNQNFGIAPFERLRFLSMLQLGVFLLAVVFGTLFIAINRRPE